MAFAEGWVVNKDGLPEFKKLRVKVHREIYGRDWSEYKDYKGNEYARYDQTESQAKARAIDQARTWRVNALIAIPRREQEVKRAQKELEEARVMLAKAEAALAKMEATP